MNFEWVLPGHGSFHHLPAEEMRERMRTVGQWAVTHPEQEVDHGKVRC
ncbi:hypothetical protein [Streptomyces sp. NPDC058755]